MKARPSGLNIIVEPIELDSVTDAGIIIPDNVKEKPQKGTVTAVGVGTKDEPMEIAEKDIILFRKNSGIEIELDSKQYLLLKQSDVLAII